MKNKYLLKLENEENEVFTLDFYTTRSKIDKAFFDFAFLVPFGSLLRVTLYLLHDSSKVAFNNSCELLNEAVRKCV